MKSDAKSQQHRAVCQTAIKKNIRLWPLQLWHQPVEHLCCWWFYCTDFSASASHLSSESQTIFLFLHRTSVSFCRQVPAPSPVWLQQVAGSLLQHLLAPGCEPPPEKTSCICLVTALDFGFQFSCNYPAKGTKPLGYNVSLSETFKSLAALISTVTSCSACDAGTTRSGCWVNFKHS